MLNFVLHASRCTNNCRFCFGRDFGDIQRNVDRELKKLEFVIDKGEAIESVEISGNDPGEYEGLPEVVRSIKKLSGASSISLLSHGKTLKGAFLQQLLDAGLSTFVIPLYGASAKVHDAVTRTPGSFEATIASCEEIRRSEATLRITTLVMAQNQDSLSEMLRFVCEFDPNASIGIPHLSHSAFEADIPDFGRIADALSKALIEVLTTQDCAPWLRNIPQCLLRFPYPFMENSSPPKMGYVHLRERLGLNKFVQIVGEDGAPWYRERCKGAECRGCIFDETCAGFYSTYVAQGLFTFRPIC